jgi:hypothetical protein
MCSLTCGYKGLMNEISALNKLCVNDIHRKYFAMYKSIVNIINS